MRISGSNAGYTTFRGSVKSPGYPLRSPVSPSLPLPCVTVCHHVSTGLYPKPINSSLRRTREQSIRSVTLMIIALGCGAVICRLRLKCDGTFAETTFCLSAKRTSPFKSAGASVQSTTGSRGVRISGSNAG